MNRLFRLILCLLLFALPALMVGAQETAIPKAGDNISLFLKRHNRSGNDYQQQFIQLNKNKLGRNNMLLSGVRYTLPPIKQAATTVTPSAISNSGAKPDQSTKSPKTKREPLFGKQWATYEIISDELAGACFYISSGHGGPDPGAIGKMGSNQLFEDEYAYDISLRLARNLMMRGATVHIIIQDAQDGIRDDRILKGSKRETCMGAIIPLNQKERLKQRSNKINALYRKEKPRYARSIFIHVDSRNIGKQTDVYFYHGDSKESKKLTETMKETFVHKYNKNQPGRGFTGTIGQRNLYVMKNTTPAGVYVELGNIQNSFDQQRIILSNNRQALANWLCEGFMTDYKAYKK